jgi:hypothetical protein
MRGASCGVHHTFCTSTFGFGGVVQWQLAEKESGVRAHTPRCYPHARMLSTRQDAIHTPGCYSHARMLSTRQDAIHTPGCYPHARMLSTRQDAIHTPGCYPCYRPTYLLAPAVSYVGSLLLLKARQAGTHTPGTSDSTSLPFSFRAESISCMRIIPSC